MVDIELDFLTQQPLRGIKGRRTSSSEPELSQHETCHCLNDGRADGHCFSQQ